jgi:hypothetical protein
VHGLVESLGAEGKRFPDDIQRDAERLEYLPFSGYDPHFEGNEPQDCDWGLLARQSGLEDFTAAKIAPSSTRRGEYW